MWGSCLRQALEPMRSMMMKSHNWNVYTYNTWHIARAILFINYK
jgi:hypothetical protein